MREIKFRGYNKENKKWFESMTIMKNNEKYYIVVEELQSGGILKPTLPVEEASIGQYTGFKDKNGVEIYEGDIIQVRRGTKRIYEGDMEFIVEFSKAGMWEVIEKRYKSDRWDLVDYYKNAEVIGNTYEEKLKDGK